MITNGREWFALIYSLTIVIATTALLCMGAGVALGWITGHATEALCPLPHMARR